MDRQWRYGLPDNKYSTKPAPKALSLQSTPGGVLVCRLTSLYVIQAARPAFVARQRLPIMMVPTIPRTRRDLMYLVSMTYASISGQGIIMNWNRTLLSDRVRRLK